MHLANGCQTIDPPRLYLRAAAIAAKESNGLTVTEAAQQHLVDLPPALDADDAKRLFKAAKAKISLACKAGHIRAIGTGRARRIDPASFAEWRLRQRDKFLRNDA